MCCPVCGTSPEDHEQFQPVFVGVLRQADKVDTPLRTDLAQLVRHNKRLKNDAIVWYNIFEAWKGCGGVS